LKESISKGAQKVAKKKLIRFDEILEFENVVQAGTREVFKQKHKLYGRWNESFFGTHKPIVVELGCGKGEYTTGLAAMFPDRNFIGVDIKGSRIWKGAKYALENNMHNVVFLRTRIEFISSFFANSEIDEIWLTFPDPQPKKLRKRLTSARFLNRYREFLRKGGLVHLKTDSLELHDYTLSLIETNGLELAGATRDLYSPQNAGLDTREILSIRTYYEQRFLDQGKKISYLKFRLDPSREIKEPDEKRQSRFF
jgi:tRNA (guanine-N7-)-methyltransferase